MKIHILSDLHLEFSDFLPPRTDADVVVLAGDICVGAYGIDWAWKHFDVPVIYVAGNHEFYGYDLMVTTTHLRQRALQPAAPHAGASNIHFLDCDATVINGVRFLCATLWTDFELYGQDVNTIEKSMAAASMGMADFKVIRFQNARFSPGHARELFLATKQFLIDALAEPFEGKTVVVTHHPPSSQSIHPAYLGDRLTPAFASNLDHLMGIPTLWIHGHIHSSLDYTVKGTRVVCNPRGYTSRIATDPGDQENTDFDAGLVIEV